MMDPLKMRQLCLPLSAMLAIALLSAGCVRRTMTINTKPEGATVSLNDEVIGTTPISKDFLWYGDYDVIVRKEGFETLKTHHRLKAPWYQIPGIDFFAEALVPFEIHDQQAMCFELEPAQTISREELLKNAKTIRDETLYGSEEKTATQPAK